MCELCVTEALTKEKTKQNKKPTFGPFLGGHNVSEQGEMPGVPKGIIGNYIIHYAEI